MQIALGEHSDDVQMTRTVPKAEAVELKHVKAKFCRLTLPGEADLRQCRETSHGPGGELLRR